MNYYLTVLSTTINTNLDLDSLFGGIVDIIIKIAMYVGIALAVGGVFSLVLAYKDENAEGQSRAVRIIVVGGALIIIPVGLAKAAPVQHFMNVLTAVTLGPGYTVSPHRVNGGIYERYTGKYVKSDLRRKSVLEHIRNTLRQPFLFRRCFWHCL